ncbi:AAA+ family ATPase [Palleronia abyssalis]|uniref:AAA+ family ATPase n=1 Tax=Palleronia abyssalis TaxID=1501240 RepID=A0A2R8BVQ6_9RHOB|nr:AAA+ family ATPase [Palleronia abyssalis]SPJ24231.1 hypothetical protein PAA8504_02059 [Palleronia abyssalis]
MRHIIPALVTALLLSTPAIAQEATEDPDMPIGDTSDVEQGLDLLSEGTRQLLRGLMGEVEPRMRDLAESLENFDFNGIGVDDLGAYHPPEMLPNGDIILRRKEDRPIDTPMDDEIEI